MGFLRKQAKVIYKSDSPSDWKTSKPNQMGRKVWEEMHDRQVGRDYEEIREKNQQNRQGSDSSNAKLCKGFDFHDLALEAIGKLSFYLAHQ